MSPASAQPAGAVEPPPPAPVEAPPAVPLEPAPATPSTEATAPVLVLPPPSAVVIPQQSAPAPVGEDATTFDDSPAEAKTPEEWKWTDMITLGGYVEAYYSWNFRKPENKLANNRWIDERHNSFTLATAALDLKVEKGAFASQVTLMFGPTADRWYFEGVQPKGSSEDALLAPGAYSNETWKHIQNAWASYTLPVGRGLTITGGLMPTQVGFEPAAVKDNWNFSRSNLFNYLPFFHLGARVSYPVTDNLTLTGAVYNGWNQPVDLNSGKAISFVSSYTSDKWLLNLLYLGGNERAPGDPNGDKPWRNLFDAVAQFDATARVSLAAEANGGFERGELGTDGWFAGAAYVRVKATEWLYFAARGDGIYESVASRGGVSSPIFFGGANHIASGTLTAEVRPIDGISFRLEYRHDDSDKGIPLFYKRGLNADGGQRAAKEQDTLTLGMTGWF